MSIETEYEIHVSPDLLNTEAAFRKLIEYHNHLFERSVMSKYAGDMRYSYIRDSFTVTEVERLDDTQGSFTFEANIQYYEGCKDNNGVVDIEDTVEYSFDKNTGLIKFTLNETPWKLDN